MLHWITCSWLTCMFGFGSYIKSKFQSFLTVWIILHTKSMQMLVKRERSRRKLRVRLVLFFTNHFFVVQKHKRMQNAVGLRIYFVCVCTVEPPNMNTLYKNNLFILIKNCGPNLGPIIIRNKLYIIISYIFFF